MVVFNNFSMHITAFTIQQMTTFGVYLADLGPGVGAGLGTFILTGQFLYQRYKASSGPQRQAPYRKTFPDAPPPPPSTISRQRVNADQPLLTNELDKGGFGAEKVCSKCDLEDIEVSEASRDSIEQEPFAGFSFINPKMADLLIDESCPGSESDVKHSKSDSSRAYNDLVLTNELGKGGFGTVYLAEFKQQRGEYFAVKVLEKQEALEQKGLVETERRVLTLAKDNPFIVHLYSTHEDKEHLYFIMEFLSGGSLRSLIQDGPLDLARSRFYSAEIIVGLQFLHRNGVIHRDLKPDNVMIDKDGHIKIIDFGLCGFMEHEKLTTSHCGTLPYMSPEVLLSDPYSFSTDWWSFGVLLHELLTSQRPYDGDDVIMLMDNIVSMVHLCSITEEADDLLEKLWAFDPSFRLGEVGNIRDHPFYDTLSWSALEQRAMDPPKVEQDSSKRDLEDFEDSEASKDSVHQEQFVGFSFINPKMADLLIDESCPGSESDVQHSKSDSSSDNNDLVLTNELGKGGFGTVYLAEFKRKRGEYFAVKVLEKQEVLQKNCLKYTMVERRVLTLTLDNPFLAHLYFSYQDQEHLYFIMEFLSGGSLRSLIQDGPLDLARSRFYSAEIVVGLQFLHRNGVIHRDLKPDNVMIDKDGHIKIIDFGLCGFMEHEKLTTSHCGTLPYMSPEVLLSDPYSFSTDWWSFGVLLHELLTSQRPYDGDDVIMLMDNIVSMVHLCSITEEADDLLEKLWAFDPSFRLGEVGNIRDHPFYDTLSWSALEQRAMDPPKVEQDSSKRDLEDFEDSEASKDSVHQEQFVGFSFINPKMADLLIDESCPGSESDVQHSKSDSSSDNNDLVLTNELGKGGFGTVYLAEFKRKRGEYFAVKVLEKQEVLQKNCLKYTMVERRVLTLTLDNPFLAHLYFSYQDQEHLYFIMEFLSGGSLRSLIQDGPLDLARSRFYSAEIVVGLQFLHRNGVIHRDLKPDNVMIDKDGHIKIIDFGLCGFMEHEKLTTSHCGTLPYMSPEALLSDPYSFSTDWWSFGVLLHELLTGQRPYDGDDVIMLMDNIVSMVHLCSITEEADDLLEKLWAFDPSFRLGEVGNIRDHPFYDTLSWSALEQRAMDPPKVEQVSSKPDLEDFEDSKSPPVKSQESKDSVDQEPFSYIDPKMADLLIDESCPVVDVVDVQHSKSETGISPWLWLGAAVLTTGFLFVWLR